jgi:hypothetical protein
MASEEHSRLALESLKVKATHGTPSEVETVLGRFRGDAATAAAEEAAQSALGAKRWANLAYLADFLADVTAPHPPSGGGEDSDKEYGDSGEDSGEDSGDEVVPVDGVRANVIGAEAKDVSREPVANILALVAPEESSLADRVLALYTVDLDDHGVG